MLKKYLLLSFLFIFSLTLSYFNIAQAATIAERLNGKILLQVQSHGEAWYVSPQEKQRIYLKDGDVAYGVMSRLGLGITNANLKKIPTGVESRFACTDNDNDGLCNKLEEGLGTDMNDADTDNDGFSDGVEVKSNYDPLSTSKNKLVFDYSLTNSLKGKILLQVQSHGEAWYLNPSDGKKYYMPDGPSAYQIMRFLSLGITNQDLSQIPISSFSVTPPTNPNDSQAPSAPSNLVATVNSTQITLTWSVSTDNVGVSQYSIERSLAATTGFTPIASSINNSYLNSGLSANTTYYYRVRAQDAAGNFSGYSNIVNKETGQLVLDTQVPTAPTNLTATATSTQITLAWRASTDNIAVTQYQIERSINASSGFSLMHTINATSYLNSGLSANTTYYYRVRAQDAAGNFSGYSSVVSARTGQVVIDSEVPTTPLNLTAVASSTQITLTWASSTDNIAVTQYQIERSIAVPNNFLPLTTITGSSYIDDHLSASTTYYYRVRATDAAGNLSGYSAAVFATTGIISLVDGQEPTMPTNLIASSTGSTQVSLTWASSADNIAVTQYSLERSTNINFNSPILTINIISTSYIDNNLSPSTTYYYRVRAVDAAGNISTYSNVVNITTPASYSISSIVGEDYTLAANVTATNFSGYVCSGCSNASTTFIWTNWATIEPQNTSPRTYNWAYIDSQLATAAANGKKVSLMIHSTVAGGINERSAVPDWVYAEFNLPAYDQLVNMGGTSQIHIIPSWRPEIRARFEELIAALGARYKNNNTIESIYITAVSHASGEELYIANPQLTTLERDWGLTPQVLQTWLESRMSAWLQAFSGEERKLVWVGSATGLSWNDRPDFEAVARNLIDYAAIHNIGGRAGLVECYLDKIGDYLWSNFKDGNGYLYVNEDSLRFDGRYWGDENEEYGPSFTRFGVDHSSPVRYRFAIMRTLQARMRFLWTTQFTETINPPLSNYARLSFGKNVYTSTDAWSFLFQSPQLGPTPIKNFERWLIQRDLIGGMTVPTQRVNRVFDAGGAYASSTLWYDYTARRTDFASGNNYMYFGLDDRFVTNGAVQIKVEMLDNAQTSWHLDYYDSSGNLSSTSNITNTNDGQKKTYTLTLNNPNFANQFISNMDFRLVNVGPGDLTVSWVRLVRNAP